MASSKEYFEYIQEQLSDLNDISYRAMMGEYIIYYRDKIIGGIYDNRFLVKPVKSAISMMPIPIWNYHTKVQKKCCWLMMLKIKHF